VQLGLGYNGCCGWFSTLIMSSSQEMLGIFIVISHKIQAFVATDQSFI
jgi:hypothetical protein